MVEMQRVCTCRIQAHSMIVNSVAMKWGLVEYGFEPWHR